MDGRRYGQSATRPQFDFDPAGPTEVEFLVGTATSDISSTRNSATWGFRAVEPKQTCLPGSW